MSPGSAERRTCRSHCRRICTDRPAVWTRRRSVYQHSGTSRQETSIGRCRCRSSGRTETSASAVRLRHRRDARERHRHGLVAASAFDRGNCATCCWKGKTADTSYPATGCNSSSGSVSSFADSSSPGRHPATRPRIGIGWPDYRAGWSRTSSTPTTSTSCWTRSSAGTSAGTSTCSASTSCRTRSCTGSGSTAPGNATFHFALFNF